MQFPKRSALSQVHMRACQANAKSPMIGKPLQRIADRPAVNDASADAAYGVDDHELSDGRSLPGSYPADADEHSSGDHDRSRTEAIDQVAVKRNEPGDCDEKCRECHLDRR